MKYLKAAPGAATSVNQAQPNLEHGLEHCVAPCVAAGGASGGHLRSERFPPAAQSSAQRRSRGR